MRAVRGTLNRVELIGWLGNAPEVKQIGKESSVCSFSVATKRLGGRAHGEIQHETEWMTVECWDRLANRMATMLQRGSRVLVMGSLHTQSWEDKQTGQRRYRTVVRAQECMLLTAPDHDSHEDDVDTEEVVG
jgi:single-strand DNA-binding protein